jgi:hypothetical protein
MAISLISPGVKITEQDLVTSNQSASSTIGAFSGQFTWGPIEVATQVAGESDLVTQFGKPTTNNNVDFLSAANFLGYSSPLFVVRVANTALNATTETATGSGGVGTGQLVKNDDAYLNTASFNIGPFIGKYAGDLGNALKVSTCPSSTAWSSSLTGTFTVAAGATQVVGAGSAANTELRVGDQIVIGGRTAKVQTIANTTHFTLDSAHLSGASAVSATRRWEFFNEFDQAPATTAQATLVGATNDEMHVVVVDRTGAITGTANTVLEKYASVSKATNARSENGGTNYYKEVINQRSDWVRWAAHDNAGTNWGTNLTAANGTPTAFTSVTTPKNYNFNGGTDGVTLTDGDRVTGFLKYSNKSEVPATIIIAGQGNATVVNRLIGDVAEVRKDAIVCISPLRANVVNNVGSEATSIATWADTVTRSTYAVADSGWKYQYDKYNDVYVYVPLNADVAGCMARNDLNAEAWLSPAGFNAGRIQNLVRLAFNPTQAERDTLYKTAVNPVSTQVGRGTILFGDKTFVTRNTSTNRINVRRLFIELEKTIGVAADNVLFDQNDETTRSNFVNLITPYLRSVQARRGIAAFRVVCDGSNNPEDVVNANEFVCDIFVQPIRSVNFIQLNFVSVRGTATFNQIAG